MNTRIADPVHIYKWLRIDENITTSGQPSEDELKEINDLGVTKVINLGLHEHEKALPDEASAVLDAGMEYKYIPVAFDKPTENDFQQFCDEMARSEGSKVHVHCIVNARVSAFFYRYNREKKGLDENQARSMMLKIWNPLEHGEKGKPWAAFIARN